MLEVKLVVEVTLSPLVPSTSRLPVCHRKITDVIGENVAFLMMSFFVAGIFLT